MPPDPAPAAPVRTVGPHELFFSMTDGKGVITAANAVFTRLSAFGRDELLGAPHNLIRHPDMPAGVFHAMWASLLAGRPFAGYVRNRAKDGAAYDVFATVTPLGDGYLSVRGAPSRPDLHAAAHALYARVRAHERSCRDGGASAAAAAGAGADHLTTLLGEQGFTSYEEFMHTALPAEVTARAAAPVPAVAPGPLGDVLAAALDVGAGLDDALGGLAALAELVDALQRASDEAQATAADLRTVTGLVGEASARVAGAAPVLVRTSDAMARVAGELSDGLHRLASRLGEVRAAVMEQRFRIALARLHNDMVVAFAAEDDDRALTDPLDVVPLCRALREDLEGMAGAAETAARALDAVGADIEQAREQLAGFRTFLSTWRIQVPRYGVARQLGGHVGPVDDHLARGHGRIAALRELAVQCVAAAQPVDRTALSAAVQRIRQAVDGVVPVEPAAQPAGTSAVGA